MEIHLKASKIDSGPFLDAFPPLSKNKGGTDASGIGGRAGEP
jgi:hypothetical protein